MVIVSAKWPDILHSTEAEVIDHESVNGWKNIKKRRSHPTLNILLEAGKGFRDRNKAKHFLIV